MIGVSNKRNALLHVDPSDVVEGKHADHRHDGLNGHHLDKCIVYDIDVQVQVNILRSHVNSKNQGRNECSPMKTIRDLSGRGRRRSQTVSPSRHANASSIQHP